MRSRTWLGRMVIAAGLCLVSTCRVIADNPTSPLTSDQPAVRITNVVFRGATYATCSVDPAKDDIRVYWDDDQGKMLGNFTALQKQAEAKGGKLVFAANAGMFQTRGKPCGLFVQNGDEKFPLNLNDGYGNFYLKPNGVFLINANHHALVIESSTYPALPVPALWATQSGPLLIHGGDINPDFMVNSKNRKLRSGVGISPAGHVVFALSKQMVTFYEFAELFRDQFGCKNALFLDGEISDFWTPDMIESEGEHHFGPMIGVVEDAKHEGVTATPAAP